jgi:hypothetical protein
MSSSPLRDAVIQRQECFTQDFVAPMVTEARNIGIPMTDIIMRILELDITSGR